MDWLLVVAGFALLLVGGEFLVRGACGVAVIAKMRPAVVGLTVVAAGTSMPELVVSIQSAFAGSPGLAAGNVVGSNIFNIAAILGITAMLSPLRIEATTIRLEWPVMMLTALLAHLLMRDALIDRFEGGCFLLGLVLFTGALVWGAGRDPALAGEADQKDEIPTASFGREGAAAVAFNVFAIVIGAALLAGGSSFLVTGASSIAAAWGLSEAVIGLTIVAGGTSTPELVSSIVAARRGQAELAVGNVIGSNIFNILGILGATALIHPLSVPTEIFERDTWWMLGASLLLLPLMKSGLTITRREGAALLFGFTLYLTLLLAKI